MLPIVTSEMQYKSGYPVNSIDANEGNILARKSTKRTYGYELYNKRLGKSFMWFKFKRDAVLKINEIKGYK